MAFRLDRSSPTYWKVTLDDAPFNFLNQALVDDLTNVLEQAEASPDLKVIVIDSAVPDFFIAHFDLGSPFDFSPRPSGLPSFADITARLEQLPAVTIAKIRGRARGGGSEIFLAFDLRFGAKGRAIFGQPEVGLNIIPGGGGIERLVA